MLAVAELVPEKLPSATNPTRTRALEDILDAKFRTLRPEVAAVRHLHQIVVDKLNQILFSLHLGLEELDRDSTNIENGSVGDRLRSPAVVRVFHTGITRAILHSLTERRVNLADRDIFLPNDYIPVHLPQVVLVRVL